MSYIIYTDGSCRANGRPNATGGFGVVVTINDELVEGYRRDCAEGTTNNREELKAILYALSEYGQYNPIVYSDSAYCVNAINTWMWDWKYGGWLKKSDGLPPENLDLFKAFETLFRLGLKMDLRKIQGHAGHKWNEMADRLATGQLQRIEKEELKVGE